MKKSKKKLLNLSDMAVEKLISEQKRTGKSQTKIVEDLLLTGFRFPADIEDFISDYCKRTKLTREECVERFVSDSVRASLRHESKSQ